MIQSHLKPLVLLALFAPFAVWSQEEPAVVESLPALEEAAAPSLSRSWALGLGGESRLSKKMSSTVEYDDRVYPSMFVAYRERWFQTLGEISYFNEETRTGNLSIKYDRAEYRHWFRGLLYQEKTWTPFAGIGVGLYQEDITSSFYANSVARNTGIEPTLGLEAGLQATFFDVLFSSVNFRALKDMPEGLESNSEDINWSIQFQVGIVPL